MRYVYPCITAEEMRIVRRAAITIIACAVLAALYAPGCQDDGDKQVLTIFHAGSLTVPLKEVSKQFMAAHPNIEVRAEAAGSRDCARKISDLDRRCDVMASADYTVIDELLMGDHADFNIRFATNEMAIAYTGESRRAGEITGENWHEVLLADGVAFGRADPDRDPCGYRTVMVMQLAERHLNVPHLAERLRAKDGKRFMRPKETDLLALLESGEIDYLFIYRSVASQHGLKMVILPDEINLKDPAHGAAYAEARVAVTGKTPKSPPIVKRGKPMVYSVTIPKNAANREAAEAYVKFLLSDEGKAVMERNGQPSPRPAKTDGYANLPESLKPLCCE